MVVVVALLLVASVVAVVGFASRVRGPRWLRGLQRLAGVLVAQLCAVTLVFLVVNDQDALFASWSDLFGRQLAAAVPPRDAATLHHQQATVASALARSVAARATGAADVDGLLVSDAVRGPASGLADRMIVYLPPQYFQPRWARTRFPVLELLDGHPGTPTTWVHGLHVDRVERDAAAAHHSLPFVLLMPDVNVEGRYDTDCADVVRGPAVDTLLGDDVPAVARTALRVRTDRAGWATMGYSEGGYCAVELAERHPGTFGAAVGMSGGYGTSPLALGPPAIYGDLRSAELAASPIWRIRHLPVAPISYLLTASRQETDGSYQESAEFAADVRPPATADTLFPVDGGHDIAAWAAVLPTALEWLSTRPGMSAGSPPGTAVAPPVAPPWSPARVIPHLPPVVRHHRHRARPTPSPTGRPSPAPTAPTPRPSGPTAHSTPVRVAVRPS